jgi:hypothetical protein
MTGQRQSWKAQPEASSKRGAMLFFLGILIACLVAYVIYLAYRPDRLRPYLVSISVVDYDAVYPKINAWNGDVWNETAQKNGLRKFEVRPSDTSYQNQEGFDDLLRRLQDSTVEPGQQAIDLDQPLFLTLRCHACTRLKKTNGTESNGSTTQADDMVTCELIINNKSGPLNNDNVYTLEDFLIELSKTRAKQIVVFADICDIDYLPAAGIVINPISKGVKADLSRVAGSLQTGQQVWVMLPTSGVQRSHIDRNGRTLFQVACQEQFRLVDKGEFLNLRDYYDQVLWYCAEATKNKQTPLLYLATSSSKEIAHVTQKTEAEWQLASEVKFTIKEGDPVKDDEPDAAAEKDEAKDNPASNEQPVAGKANQSRPRSRLIYQAEPASEPPETPTKEATKPLSPSELWWQRFMQMRTAYQSDSPVLSDMWSPAVSKPMAWRQAIRDAMAKDSKLAPIDELRLIQADLNNPPFKYWLKPQLLPSKADQWQSRLSDYQHYIIALSEFSFWHDLSLRSMDDVDQSTINAVSESLVGFHSALPKYKDGFDSAMQSTEIDFPSQPYTSIEKEVGDLVKRLQKQITTEKNWTWDDETTAIDLEHDLILPDMRTTLQSILVESAKLKSYLEIDLTDFKSQSADINDDNLSLQTIKTFAELASKVSQLYGPKTESMDDDKLESALEWSQTYFQGLDNLAKDTSKTLSQLDQWHLQQLIALKPDNKFEANAAIVVYPIPRSTLVIDSIDPKKFKLDDPKKTDFDLTLNVRQLDGELPKAREVDVQWFEQGFEGAKLVIMQDEKATAWLKNSPKKIACNNGVLKFRCRLPAAVNPGATLQFAINDLAPSHTVDIYRRNVELIALETTKFVDATQKNASDANEVSFNLVGPALGPKANAEYRFFLKNFDDKDPYAIVKLNLNDDQELLVAESKPVKLKADTNELTEIFLEAKGALQEADDQASAGGDVSKTTSIDWAEVSMLGYTIHATSTPNESPITSDIAGPSKLEYDVGKELSRGRIALKNQSRSEVFGWRETKDVTGKPSLVVTSKPGRNPWSTFPGFELKPTLITSNKTPIKSETSNDPPIFTFGLSAVESGVLTLDLGDFPRWEILNFDRSKKKDTLSTTNAYAAQIRISSTSAPTTTYTEDRIIFPCNDNDGTAINHDGTAIKHKELRVQGSMESVDDSIRWVLLDDQELTEEQRSNLHLDSGLNYLQDLKWRDRNYVPRIAIGDNGRMSLRFDVADVDRRITTSIPTEGVKILRLAADFDNNSEPDREWTLVFDYEPPEVGNLVAMGNPILSSESPLTIELQNGEDTAAGLDRSKCILYMSLHDPAGTPSKLVDKSRMKMITINNDNKFKLTTSIFTENDTTGKWDVFLVTSDRAGNFQPDSKCNGPLTVEYVEVQAAKTRSEDN